MLHLDQMRKSVTIITREAKPEPFAEFGSDRNFVTSFARGLEVIQSALGSIGDRIICRRAIIMRPFVRIAINSVLTMILRYA
jgi:hypothetical protein